MKRSTKLVLASGALIVVIGGCSAAVSSSSSNSSSSSPPAAAASSVPSDLPSIDNGGLPSDSATPEPPPAPQHDKVTFVVKGSSADVTYGPAGSDLSGTVPMKKTMTIPDNPPAYYAITAQLGGGGEVSCKILVNGKTISSGRATGGYNIAQCEIVSDFSGGWESATG